MNTISELEVEIAKLQAGERTEGETCKEVIESLSKLGFSSAAGGTYQAIAVYYLPSGAQVTIGLEWDGEIHISFPEEFKSLNEAVCCCLGHEVVKRSTELTEVSSQLSSLKRSLNS